MNPAVAAALFAGLLVAGQRTAPSNFIPAANAESVESGEVSSSTGERQPYRIRLLPIASFPDLPDAIVTQLTNRGCMIPQSFEAQRPENVIHGSFRAPGSSDWAALCSVDGRTTLYVFFGGQFDAPFAVRSQPDTAWLGAEPGNSTFGSAWGIAVNASDTLRSSRQFHGAASFDHDAIDDARLEHSSTVRYWDAGKWIEIVGAK
jgi:hypothetical protein